MGLLRTKLDEYLASTFFRAGYVGVDIAKTPLGTRIIIYADRPALLIGKRGETIRKLQNIFEKHFSIENPQVTIMGVENPELNARVMASRLAIALEKGFHFRRAAFITLRRIMAAGALGAEIVISGKLTTERAKFEKLRMGKIYRSGDQVNYLIDRAVANVLLIPGIYGIEVIITRPGVAADHIEISELQQASQQGGAAQASETPASGAPQASSEGGGLESQP